MPKSVTIERVGLRGKEGKQLILVHAHYFVLSLFLISISFLNLSLFSFFLVSVILSPVPLTLFSLCTVNVLI